MGWGWNACKACKRVWREKLFNRQKTHFSLHHSHRCYSKNERLGRLPYCCINFSLFCFVSTATLNCNFFFFPVYNHNLIFSHYFCRGFNEDSFFCRSFSWNKPLVWESCWRCFERMVTSFLYLSIFLWPFLWIMCIAEFNYVSSFVFHSKKTKQSISKLCF